MTWTRKAKWMLAVAGIGVALMALAYSMGGARAIPLSVMPAQAGITPPTGLTRAGGYHLGQAGAGVTDVSPESGTQRAVNQETSAGKTGGITVSGQGSASSAPDLAIVTLGVEATGETIKEARNSAASALGKIIDTLLESEVAEKDIQTSRLSIHPRYSTRTITKCPTNQGASGTAATEGPTPRLQEVQPEGECYTERQSVITGYEVNNQLVVRLRDLDTVGDVIDDVTDAGGDLTRFQGISFSLEDTGPLKYKALTAAIEDAQAKADHIADKSGVTLGELVRISEASSQIGDPYRASRLAFAMESVLLESDVPTSVEGGLVIVSAAVQAMYGIK